MSKNTYTRDELKASDEVLRLADAIKSDLKIGEGGVAADLEKGFIEKNLPGNITMADIKRIDAFRTDLVAAAALALGETSIDAFKKDKNLQQTSLQFPLNKDKISVQIDRYRKFPNRMGGEGAPDIERYCQVNARYQAAASGNRGEYKRVKEHLGAMGAKLFS